MRVSEARASVATVAWICRISGSALMKQVIWACADPRNPASASTAAKRFPFLDLSRGIWHEHNRDRSGQTDAVSRFLKCANLRGFDSNRLRVVTWCGARQPCRAVENPYSSSTTLRIPESQERPMKVMVFVKATPNSEAGLLPSDEATQKMFTEMGKFNEALAKAGIIQAADGLKPSLS